MTGEAVFLGDLSEVPYEARCAAVALKRGRIALDEDGSGLYDRVVANREEVERSLNDDFLTLHVDEESRVAWAEMAPDLPGGTPQVADRFPITRNDACLFYVLDQIVCGRRREGHEDPAEWVFREDEARGAWEEALGDKVASGDPRKRDQEWLRSLNRAAVGQRWVVVVDGDTDPRTLRATSAVDALARRGFAAEWVSEMKKQLEERRRAAAEDGSDE